jgi:hypothetical protein
MPVTLFPRQPETSASIAAFEAQYQLRLPDEYRQFLLQYGGATLSPHYFDYPCPWTQEATRTTLDQFETLPEAEQALLNLAGEIPPVYLPIASNNPGDVVLIGSDSSNLGQIFYWVNGLQLDRGSDPYYVGNIAHVANSLGEFLALFQPET